MKAPTMKRVLPLAVVATGLLIATVLVTAGARVETSTPEAVARLVRSRMIEPRTHTLDVLAQGTVEPRTESELMAEVAGRVVEVAPSFAPGGFFARGDVLVRLDARDQELALRRTAASLDAARSRRALAEKTFERTEKLRSSGALSAREFDDAENSLILARASFIEAEAAHAQAERDLERTTIRAPYGGRVRRAQADVGQFVSRGSKLGSIYATDYAEVPLPIPDTDLAFLDLDLGSTGGPEVELTTTFAGRRSAWDGEIVRTEGEIDPRTRMVTVIARIEDPYGREREARGDYQPLAVGMFVDARIRGRTIPSAVSLPRTAVRSGNRVLVIDEDNILRFRDVEIVRNMRDDVLISHGLSAGDEVCVSPLDAATEGTHVRTLGTS